MTTETYSYTIVIIPPTSITLPVVATHQDFDRIVTLQGLHVPEDSTYTIPSDTVRRLRTVSLHNDGLIQSSGFFELTSPGVFLAVSGEGTIDLQRAATIDVQSLAVDAGQTLQFSNPGQFQVVVKGTLPAPLNQIVTLETFTRNGFGVNIANTLDMGGELAVDGPTTNLDIVTGQRLNVGSAGSLIASHGESLGLNTPLLVNQGLVDAEGGAHIDIGLAGNVPTLEGAEGSSFRVGAGSSMTIDATQSFEIAASNTRFHVEDGGSLQFLDRVGVNNGTRFDLEIDNGGYAELRGVRNYNETEGFVSITNHGLLELTASTTSVRPHPPGFLSTDENQFTPTDLINDGTIRVIGDQTPNTVTKLEFNATITNYVGGGAVLGEGRWELFGAPIEYHNTPDIAEFLENTGIAIINTNVTDVMWSDRIVNDVGLDYTPPNTELWYNDAEVVFSGAARWDYLDTLRENRNVVEFRDHHHFHTVGDFANSGDLTVDNDSELDVNGTFTNRGGTAIFSGGSTLNADDGVVVEGGLVRIEADSQVDGVTFEGESGALLPADTTWVVRDVFDPGDPDHGILPTVQPATIEFVGRRVVINFGNVVLEGEQASFEAVQSLEINAGPLLVSAGNHLTITPENEDGVLQPVLINDGIGSGFYGRLEVATGGSLTVDAVDGIESWAGDVIVGGGSYLFAPKVNFLAELNGQPLPFPGSFHVDGEAATDLVNIAPHITLSGDGIIRGLSGQTRWSWSMARSARAVPPDRWRFRATIRKRRTRTCSSK